MIPTELGSIIPIIIRQPTSVAFSQPPIGGNPGFFLWITSFESLNLYSFSINLLLLDVSP